MLRDYFLHKHEMNSGEGADMLDTMNRDIGIFSPVNTSTFTTIGNIYLRIAKTSSHHSSSSHAPIDSVQRYILSML